MLGVKEVVEQEENECSYKRATQEIAAVTEMFCYMTISMSILVCDIILYVVLLEFTTEKLGKTYKGFLCIIFYNCMWIYNYLKIKSLMLKRKTTKRDNIFARHVSDKELVSRIHKNYYKLMTNTQSYLKMSKRFE